MARKEKEREILSMVYANDRIEEIIVGENPDFKVREKHHRDLFGVEITELYYSESDARVDNIRGYLGEILDGKRFRHKRDVKDLAVRQVTLQSDGKPDQQVAGIMREYPSISDYVQMVVDVIDKKSARIRDYTQDVILVNLIVHDTGRRLIKLPRSDFHQVFFTPSLRTALRDSGFSEIFFITVLEENTEVYIPLKMQLLVSQFYMFDGALQGRCDRSNVQSCREELSLFASYLYRIGTKGIRSSDVEGEFEVICGNYGIMIADEKGLIVRDHGGYPLPESAVPVANSGEKGRLFGIKKAGCSEEKGHPWSGAGQG